MKHSIIAAAALVAAAPSSPAFDLYDVEPSLWPDNKCKPRSATGAELRAYADWIRAKAGLSRELELSDVDTDRGTMRYGKVLRAGGTEYVDTPCFETFTMKKVLVRREPEFETGSYTLLLPGRERHNAVTFERLDEAGEVISTSTMPVDPKKHGVVWDKKTVAEACALPKVVKARAKRAVPAGPAKHKVLSIRDGELQRDEYPTHEAARAVEDALMADGIEAIAISTPLPAESTPPAPMADGLEAKVEALSARVAALESGAAKPETETRSNVAPIARDSRAVRERLVRRYLAMRARRSLDVAALEAGAEFARTLETRAQEAEAKVRGLEMRLDNAEFETSDLHTRLATAELKANEAAAIYEPQLDEKTARIVRLENELIELRSKGRIRLTTPLRATAAAVVPFPVRNVA